MKGILFRTLRASLLDMQPTAIAVGYHSNPDNDRAFFGDRHEGFRVPFEGEEYFVRLNSTTDMEQFEILLGHSRGQAASRNNPDITFTEEHFDSHALLVVAPSFRRCGGALSVEPPAIGIFPARVTSTKNRFAVGFPDSALFPRLFRLCLAKKRSIESQSHKSQQSTTKPKQIK